MKNYDTWDTKPFETTQEEIDSLGPTSKMNIKFYKTNLERIQKKFGETVVWFGLRSVPEKRSKHDSAILLVFQKEDGTFWAKRHNNSQFFSLSY